MTAPAHLRPSELAAVNALITKMEEDGKDSKDMQVLTTPVIAVVAEATLATLAVVCTSAPGDVQVISQMKQLASQLQSRASHEQLVELRRRAVTAASKKVGK